MASADYIRDRLAQILELWCDLCTEATQRDHGLAVITAPMLAREQPDISTFARELDLPLTDMAGRLNRLHQQYCPEHPHPRVPELIMLGLPNLGFFL